ncbi:glycosyltransferase family 2 protein [Tessaracoccus flavus]|uniref:Uncharacterized protein n=1 Tax=Tessaracoccus flavus TaxID=1610493 RepID=A0A1Q2CI52_9ACTN|nr:glycosyltransferase [Tessaracoccus flavus]AQP45753.1 hypothetical protein RPIT_13835 [Tessaracoccus flavus]SDZ12198.1 Glycosyltransferase involved in cell wall bisynthesis [Tessaracoccus flavus]
MPGTVSVIVPVYNAEAHLPKCLASLAGQTYRDLEIILVDDGSTDRSLQMLEAFAAEDTRARVVTQKNAGVSRARNVGLASAQGDYVSFVDSDDWLEPETYASVVGAFDGNDIDFVSFQYFVDQAAESVAYGISGRFHGLHGTVTGLEAVLETTNRFVWTRVFRRELIGPTRFREDLHWGEDTVFVIEVARRARWSFLIPDPYYHYVQSKDSATRSKVNPKRLTGIEMTHVLQRMVEEAAPHLAPFVVATRANIFATLAQDAYAQPRRDWTPEIPTLIKTIRTESSKIVLARGLGMSTRLKAGTLAVSPMLFVRLNQLRLERLSGRARQGVRQP